VVGLAYAPPGQDFILVQMDGGPDTWTYTITADSSWQSGDINFYVYAFDRLGNQSPNLHSGTPIAFKHCIC
jgi:hypothetical protein